MQVSGTTLPGRHLGNTATECLDGVKLSTTRALSVSMGGAALAGSLYISLSLPMSFLLRGAFGSAATLETVVPLRYLCNVGSSCRGFFALVGKTCAFGMNVFSHTMCNDGGLDMSGVWEGVLQ